MSHTHSPHHPDQPHEQWDLVWGLPYGCPVKGGHPAAGAPPAGEAALWTFHSWHSASWEGDLLQEQLVRAQGLAHSNLQLWFPGPESEQGNLMENSVPSKVLGLGLVLADSPKALSVGVLRLAEGIERTGLLMAPPLHLYLHPPQSTSFYRTQHSVSPPEASRQHCKILEGRESVQLIEDLCQGLTKNWVQNSRNWGKEGRGGGAAGD